MNPLVSLCSIRLAAPEDRHQWNDYVHSHPQATFFHLFDWQTVLEKVFTHPSHSLIALQGGAVVGVLPLVRQRTLLFGDALISTPFCVYGGALGDQPAIVHDLEEYAARLARHLNVDYLQLRYLAAPRSDWLANDLYYAFQRSVTPDPQANLLAIPRKQRAEVRAAMGHGLVMTEEKEVAACHHLFSLSQRNLGTPALPVALFHTLLELFGEQCVMHTVWHGKEQVASVLSFLFGNHILPYYTGSTISGRHMSAHPFLYWSLMNWAGERGYTVFDFGRSKKGSGSFAFKVNFGFNPQLMGYSTLPVSRPGLPQNNPSNPRYRLLIRLWQHLPLVVANRLGSMISCGLG